MVLTKALPSYADWSDSNLNGPQVLESVTFVHDLVHVHQVSPDVEERQALTSTPICLLPGKLA